MMMVMAMAAVAVVDEGAAIPEAAWRRPAVGGARNIGAMTAFPTACAASEMAARSEVVAAGSEMASGAERPAAMAEMASASAEVTSSAAAAAEVTASSDVTAEMTSPSSMSSSAAVIAGQRHIGGNVARPGPGCGRAERKTDSEDDARR